MRPKRLLALLVSSTLTVLMAAATSTASADPTGPDNTPTVTLGSCASPPDNADATAQNRDAFVQLWMSRIQDKAWFANFANQGTLPDAIASEPYYSMGKDAQAWLISCLVDDMLAAAGDSATPDKVQNLQIGLDLVIFAKSQVRAMRHDLNETSIAAGPPPPTQGTHDAL